MTTEKEISDVALPAATAAGGVAALMFGWVIRLMSAQHRSESKLKEEVGELKTRTAVLEQNQRRLDESLDRLDRRVEDQGLTLGEVKLQVQETNAGTRLLKQALDSHVEQSRRNHDDLRDGIRSIAEAIDRRRQN